MDIISKDIKTITFIQSESEFNQAKMSGLWETAFNRLIGRQTHLLSIAKTTKDLHHEPKTHLGLQDIPIKAIRGSVSRAQDFTRRFRPQFGNTGSKDRWRMIYTLAATGKGFPPVELYKVDKVYFVNDGHHRISVAKHLGWRTIQANVTEFDSSVIYPADARQIPPALFVAGVCCATICFIYVMNYLKHKPLLY